MSVAVAGAVDVSATFDVDMRLDVSPVIAATGRIAAIEPTTNLSRAIDRGVASSATAALTSPAPSSTTCA